ncbi:MAG: hypothetical protein PHP35_02920, partial [Candidatus Colwellbacteria bacterium]|nr:hypothetical protein [Candidatus Colwellbacteria bacterium]
MYRLIAKDNILKTVLVELEHNDTSNIQGGDGYSYFHLSEDGYSFVQLSALNAPSADGYLLYSSITGTPIWTEQVDVVAEHN